MGALFNPDDYASLPAQQPGTNRGLVGPAIASGIEAAAGQLSSAVKGVGDLFGSPTLSNLGATGAANSEAAAQSYANPTYETGPLAAIKSGHIAGWTVYNLLKGLPQFAAPAVGAALAPAVDISALAGVGAKTLAAAAAAAPQAFGTGMQVTGNPVRALAMTPALAAMQAWLPSHIESTVASAAAEGGLKAVGMSAQTMGAAQAVIAGAQAGLIDAANPNLTPMQRIDNIGDAALAGGIMGGVIGGVAGFGGIRAVRRADPSTLTNEDLGSRIDAVLQLPKPEDAGAPQLAGPGQGSVPQEPVMAAGPDGIRQTQQSVPPVPSEFDARAQQAPATGLEPMSDPELKAAHDVLVAKAQNGELSGQLQQHLDLVKQELAARSANQALTQPGAQQDVGAVERTGDDKSGVADQGSSAPAPTSFAARLDELKQGANTAWGRQVDANDELDLATKVAERLETHPSNSLTEFATRIGLIDGDDPKKVTPLAAAVEQAKAGSQSEASLASAKGATTTTEPAAPANAGGGDRPVDAEFQKQWAQDLSKHQGVAVDELRQNPPANAAEAREQLYDMLAKGPEGEKISDKDGYNAVVDLAKKQGILDKDGRFTDAAVDIARGKPIDTKDTVDEAQRRGLNGTETSAFDDGARGVNRDKFDSIEEWKAFHDGKQWGDEFRLSDIPKGASDAETQAALGRVKNASVPDQQRDMQFLNQAVDQVYGSTVKPEEHTQLKRMVREGASPKEIDDAARYFQSGHGALVREQPASRAFKGEIVTRGAPRDPERLAAIRGVDPDVARGTEGERTQVAQRLIEAHEQRKAALKNEIMSAHTSGDLTNVDAIRLSNLLHRNDLQGVVDRLPGGRLHGDQPDTGLFMNRLAEVAASGHEYNAPDRISASPALRLHLMSGDIGGALKEVANNSSSPLYKLIARKLGGDWHQGVQLTREAYDPLRTGRTILSPDGSEKVQLFGERGMSEETFLHEMLHAYIHNKWKGAIEQGVGAGQSVIDRVNTLHDQIRDALEKAHPELTRSAIWADQVRASPDEMITWAMTNPDAQEVLKRIDIDGNKIDSTKSSLWDQFKGFVADLLGIPTNGRTMSALDHILQAGHSLLDVKEQADAAAHVPAPVINDRLTAAVKAMTTDGAAKMRDVLDHSDAKDSLFRAALKSQHATHLVEEYAERRKVVPEIKTWQDVKNQQNGIANELSKPQLVATDRVTKLQREDPKNAERVNNAALAAARGYNPELAWSKQPWLHEGPYAGLSKQVVDKAYREFNAMSAKAREAYYGEKNMLEAIGLTHMIQRLHLLTAFDASLKPLLNKLGDPLIDYVRQTDKHSPEGAAAFFRAALGKTMSDMDAHFAQVRSDPTLVKAQRDALDKSFSPVETELKTIRDQLQAVKQTPYFHLYREGDHMVAATMRVDEEGRAHPAAVKAVAAALGRAGFNDVQISPDLANPKLFMLVDSKSQRALAESALRDLASKGHVDPDSILTGPKSREALVGDSSKVVMDHLMAEIQSHPLFSTDGKTAAEVEAIEAQRDAVMNVAKEAWLNSLPTNSLARVMAHRSVVQGFSKDMALSTAHRLSVGISAAARMWARPKLNEVFTQMGQRARDSLSINDKQHPNVDLIHTLVNEVRQRDVQQLTGSQHDWTDTLRIVSNVFHLAASPVQALIDFTQLPVLVVPHLGARHGYANTLTALARHTPTALRVIREAFAQGLQVNATRAMDLSITHDVLVKAIPDKGTRDFLEHVIASGIIDTGSNVRALTRDSGINPNPKMQTLLTWATVLEQANEMTNRLVTALAARELHGGKLAVSTEDYAMRTINDTLGQYQASNAPPILSKKGPLKVAGPLLLQFKNFSINLTWKLYREVHSAMDKSLPAEDRIIAGKFIIGHAAAVTAIAGSLGIPFAGAVAGVVDKLKDELFPSEHPFDAIAAYRNFLADAFGKDAGEVIAKGVPRAFGMDLSSRVGEEDLLPLTQFLTDRRTWSDTVNEWGAQAIGAPLSMAYQEARGGDQIYNGNVLGGAAEMMPSSIRHVMQAYQMTEHGYVDSNGIPLPMSSPGASDILAQLVGITPADKAEYQDKREVAMNEHASLTRTANSLKSTLLRALQTGDTDTARGAITKAQQFDAANPSYAVLPKIEHELTYRERDAAVARTMGTPMGVSPKDAYGRSLVQF